MLRNKLQLVRWLLWMTTCPLISLTGIRSLPIRDLLRIHHEGHQCDGCHTHGQFRQQCNSTNDPQQFIQCFAGPTFRGTDATLEHPRSLTTSPVSTLTDGTRSIVENSLEEHIEFRRRQSRRIEQKIVDDEKERLMNKMLSSIKSGSCLNEFNQAGEPTIGGSVSLSFDNDNDGDDSTPQTMISSSSLSQVQGGYQSPKIKSSLASSFRPKSAAAARKRTQRSVEHNSQYQFSSPSDHQQQREQSRNDFNANNVIRVGPV